MRLPAIHFYKVIELIIRADSSLSREMVKHLNKVYFFHDYHLFKSSMNFFTSEVKNLLIHFSVSPKISNSIGLFPDGGFAG